MEVKTLFDYAARIGVMAKLEEITKSQLEGILASLGAIEDPKASLLLTAAYAHRQATRLKKRNKTAMLINEALSAIYREGKDREEARKLLGLSKWVFESLENRTLPGEVRDFQSYLEFLRK